MYNNLPSNLIFIRVVLPCTFDVSEQRCALLIERWVNSKNKIKKGKKMNE